MEKSEIKKKTSNHPAKKAAEKPVSLKPLKLKEALEGLLRTPPRPVHPGRILKREMEARGLNANRLALALALPANRITAIVNGAGGISAETALRLARYFGSDARFWMNLQTGHDIAREVRTA